MLFKDNYMKWGYIQILIGISYLCPLELLLNGISKGIKIGIRKDLEEYWV